ncbi:BREX system ATP-binding domain-containing protein [Methanoregula sp.]|uniref:BREX system ATP-binding domain-containing protein n=1 Tax=Methanoregula sp. TaxID=2052170 RepID=UPI0035631FA8
MTEFTLTLKNKDYSKYGLTGNPFPFSGVPDEHPNVYIGQDEVLTKINSVLSSTVLTGQSNHIIVTGSYGNGKSHTLKFIKSHIRDQFSEKSDTPICVGYVSQPGENFLDIYTKFMYDLGYSFVKHISQEYLGLIAYQLSKEGLIEEKIRKGQGWKQIEKGDVLISDIVPKAIQRLNDGIKFVDYTRAFIALSYEENSIYSWEWLCGEGVEYTKRQELSLGKNINDTNSIRALGSLKFILKELGFSSLILLIDEFEYIETLPSLKKQKMLNYLRHVIDLNGEGLSLIIACAPEVWQNIVAEYHAFSERIGKEANLKPLDQEKIRMLLISYLNNKRTKKNDSFSPFTERSIEQIYIHSQGNTRRVISLSSQALDVSLDLDKKSIEQDVLISIISN